jgi:phage terminase large subunit GpA-like protein
VVLMKGAQLGATDAGLDWVGYVMDVAPGLMMLVQPTLAMVKRNTLTRIDPLIETTACLRGKVSEPRSRDAGNSIFRKKFRGGELVMTGANSASGLRSTPARYLFLDEVDAYPPDAEGEGDPIDLAIKRTATFRSRRKVFMLSTPTIQGGSRIEKAYLESDQRRYFVCCKRCNAVDVITWERIQWPEGAPQEAHYKCAACDEKHFEWDKPLLISPEGGAHWKATAEAQDRRIIGFHVSSLYSLFETWADQATDFLAKHRDPGRFKTWVNTVLGEPWVETGEAPEWKRLYERREPYPIGTVPVGGLFLTAGADVQADRIEVEVVAWGRNQRSWSVDYQILEGNTSRLDDPVWTRLAELANQTWPHAGGQEMSLVRMAVDDGFNSQVVRAWWRRQSAARVMLTKGHDRATVPVGKPTQVDVDLAGKRLARGARVWPIGVSLLKSELYGWLRMDKPTAAELAQGGLPFGWCHFPEYGEGYFQGLASEALQKHVHPRTRQISYAWVKVHARNEPLDCRVMARAAAIQAGVLRLGEKIWSQMEGQFGKADSVEASPEAGGGSGRKPTDPGESEVGRAVPPTPPRPRPPTPGRRPGRRVVQSSYMRR